jgi:beta-galactosidase beta subunit
MKLYTEEQVRKAIRVAGQLVWEDEEIFASLPSIELPSDLDINKESHTHYLKGQLYIEPASNTEYAFKKGAKWMKEQILNQNK